MFDVGANAGHYGVELREGGYGRQIVSFEPISAPFRHLAARAGKDPRWDAYQLGLGAAEEQRAILIAAADVFSSFKPPSDYTARKFVGAREVAREQVTVTTLRHFLAVHPAYLDGGKKAYLKIDTQGFERGCPTM